MSDMQIAQEFVDLVIQCIYFFERTDRTDRRHYFYVNRTVVN